MTQHRNAKSKAPKGKPSGNRRGGSGLQDVSRKEEINETLENKYLDTEGQPDENVKLRHKNRNTDN